MKEKSRIVEAYTDRRKMAYNRVYAQNHFYDIFTPYADWCIRFDYTRFFVRALRLRQFRDTLISDSNQASSSNPIINEEFMNSRVNLHQILVIKLN